jgi:hypothetical protein
VSAPEQRPPGVTIAVTDHAAERFRQRVPSRTGELDARPEITARVSRAWQAGRVSDTPPDPSTSESRGTVYVADLLDRDVIFVCRHDAAAGELVVITLWERARLGPPRVPRRFTDALREPPSSQGGGARVKIRNRDRPSA